MKVTTYETLYHEDHGAIFLKHKLEKEIVAIVPSLFFSHFFIWAFSSLFLASFFYFVRSLIPTCGGIIVSIILSSLGTML